MNMLKKIVAPIIIALILAINLFLGFSRLGIYSAVDEPYWTYGRTSKFWNAVKNYKWKSTSVNDKPGITVAILSGFGLLKYDPMQYKYLRDEQKTDEQLGHIRAINFYFRLPIFLFCTMMLLVFYFFLKKLFGNTIALFGFILISFSPIIFGVSLIINPDSLLWIFLPLSLLSYFVFKKEEKKSYLILSGFFMGLALLTKYVANILYIFFFMLPFLEYIFSEEKPPLQKYLKKSFINYLIIVGVSVAIFFVFYPATWVNFNVLLKGTFLSQAFKTTWPLFVGVFAFIVFDIFALKNKVMQFILNFFSRYRHYFVQIVSAIFLFVIIFAILDTYLGMKPFDFVSILSSPKGIGASNIFNSYVGAILADTYSLIFGICPLALIALIFALYKNLRRKATYNLEACIILYFSIFILFYYFASSVNNVAATVRYQITLYPLALIISAIGLSQIISLEKIRKYVSRILAIIIVFTISLIGIFSIRPFYFAFASPLLPQKYLLNYKDMGDGSYETARYLNSLPDARSIVIWSDKGAVCAEFVGKCVIGYSKKDLKSYHFDYVIASSGRKSKTFKLAPGVDSIIDLKEAYLTENYIKKVIIGGREENYVKIVPANMLYK